MASETEEGTIQYLGGSGQMGKQYIDFLKSIPRVMLGGLSHYEINTSDEKSTDSKVIFNFTVEFYGELDTGRYGIVALGGCLEEGWT